MVSLRCRTVTAPPFDQFVRVALTFVAAGLEAGCCGVVDSSAVKFVADGRALDGVVG